MMSLLLLSREPYERNVPGKSGTAESTRKTIDYIHKGVMCCATNLEGQECSQLYDYGN